MLGPSRLQPVTSGGDGLGRQVDGDDVPGESLVPVLVHAEAPDHVEEAVVGEELAVARQTGRETDRQEGPRGALVHLQRGVGVVITFSS